MSRKMLILLPVLVAVGCNHCPKLRRADCVARQTEECCQESPACAPQAPAAPPQAQYMAPQPQYMAPQAQYMASPGFAAPPQEVTGALGLGVIRIPLIIPKMYAVPKPHPPQMVAIQQSPMMMPQMMMAPQAAPSCPSTDSANSALLMALLQAQQQHQNAPPAAPSAEEADLEARALKLEQKIDALTNALEKGQ
jgi:hypothetical protein